MKKIACASVFLGILLMILLNAQVDAAPPGTDKCDRMMKEFFSRVKMNNHEAAVKFVYTTNKWASPPGSPDADINQVQSFSRILGRFQSAKEAGRRETGGVYLYVYKIGCYDRGPVGFVFEFYRPGNDWLLHNFTIEAEPFKKMKAAAVRDIFGL